MSKTTTTTEAAARTLGTGYETIRLVHHGAKQWSFAQESPTRVENAALHQYRAHGWDGVAVEGLSILFLIKLAAFVEIDPHHVMCSTEAIFSRNLVNPKTTAADLLSTMVSADRNRIIRNSQIIRPGKQSFFPGLRKMDLVCLFDALGPDRLHQIATIFAKAPYEFRSGWPDLTLWTGNKVAFREIKSPGDRMHSSQKRLLSEILVPLSHDVSLVEVLPE
jgi:hypothetical protein